MNFNTNWNKIKYSINENTSTLVNKSKELVETSKIKYTINTEENNIEELYKLIGQELYKNFKNDKLHDNKLSNDKIYEYFNNIKKIEKKIKKLKKELNEIEDIKLCSTCQNTIDKNCTYCSYCGAKQE